jgi:hypothetical protein
LAACAEAHFVWLAIEKASDGSPVARVWFSELAEPDSAELLDRIARVEVWAVRGHQPPQKLSLNKLVEGEGGCWTAPLPADTTGLAATLCYGVVSRGSGPMLLHYHARYLDAAEAAKAAASDRLTLQIVPRPATDGWDLQVLYQGQPAAGSEVVIFDPAGNETKKQTDAQGRVHLPRAGKAGLYSIRARWALEASGEHDGKPYQQVVHYATLALRDGDAPAAANASAVSAAAPSTEAVALLRAARAARAEWRDFPGFEADVTLITAGQQASGRLRVNAQGEVHLEGLDEENLRRVRGLLRSLVAHRMPERGEDDRASFADAGAPHPLGRLIRLDYDSVMASTYRIDGDVIREVNRNTQDGRFTISVFQVHRNPEGKYLPAYYVVNSWKADGTLRSSTAVYKTWIRVGNFDLPATYQTVSAGSDEYRTLSLVFRNQRLLP